MKHLIYAVFAEYKNIVVFLHILSAVIWVGGMIAMRFAAHQSIQMIDSVPEKIERSSYALKRLFSIVAPFVVILIITAVIMAVGYGFRDSAVDASGHVLNNYAMFVYNMVHVKESLWVVMTVNFLAMVLKRNKAANLILNGDLIEAASKLKFIAKYMVPLNILLGLAAIYLGVFLRNAY
ncbi:hypothetical protein [Sulfurimonas sp. HSL-1716]|uniref:hypothetical protein n=1 Tax=Hydrocurvibacter sulfurireducens TaxID=3131937 RepID=UPI0031F7FFBF